MPYFPPTLLASGARDGATSQAQAFTNGVKAAKIIAPANSTNAFGWYRADGTTQDIYYDSNNGRLGIGTIPDSVFHARTTTANAGLRFQNIADTGSPLFSFYRARGTLGSETPIINGARVGEIQFIGFGATAYVSGAFLRAIGNATWTDTSAPTDFHIMLSDAGSVTPTERLTVKSKGRVGVNNTSPGAWLHLPASTSLEASLRIPVGVAPTTPGNGDMWLATRLRLHRSGVSEIVATGAQATGGAATAGASYTATEQTMLQKVYDAARTFGMLD